MYKSWNEYLMEITEMVASRSTCNRASVGCILVNKDRRIVSIGYNGSATGNPHRSGVGHTMRDGHCIAIIHAEMNALLYRVKEGIPIKGCTAYVTRFPCLNCSKALIQADIEKIYYRNAYWVDDYTLDPFEKNGIHSEQINPGQEG